MPAWPPAGVLASRPPIACAQRASPSKPGVESLWGEGQAGEGMRGLIATRCHHHDIILLGGRGVESTTEGTT